MNEQQYTVSFQPGSAEEEQVKSWMRQENLENRGLHHYPDNINYHAGKGTLAIIKLEDKAIGFVTWDVFRRTGHIAVAAIDARYRKSGAGQFIVETVLEHFKENGLLAVYLECAPASSEEFWRGMGFEPMPDIPGYTDKGCPSLYKTLTVPPKNIIPDSEAIQIYKFGNSVKATWQVIHNLGTNTLAIPIIAPAGKDWQIVHIKAGTTAHSDKIKNFRSGTCYDDPFLIITEL